METTCEQGQRSNRRKSGLLTHSLFAAIQLPLAFILVTAEGTPAPFPLLGIALAIFALGHLWALVRLLAMDWAQRRRPIAQKRQPKPDHLDIRSPSPTSPHRPDF